tara:strand:+ start:500 stop:874 length:375 start_codon:yes stop_codon:yes gene_type:complete
MDLYIYIPIGLFIIILLLIMTNVIKLDNFLTSQESFENKDVNDNIKFKNEKISEDLDLSKKSSYFNNLIFNLDEQASLKMLSIIKNNPDILNNDSLNTDLLNKFNSIAEFKKNLNMSSKFLDTV